MVNRYLWCWISKHPLSACDFLGYLYMGSSVFWWSIFASIQSIPIKKNEIYNIPWSVMTWHASDTQWHGDIWWYSTTLQGASSKHIIWSMPTRSHTHTQRKERWRAPNRWCSASHGDGCCTSCCISKLRSLKKPQQSLGKQLWLWVNINNNNKGNNC